MITLAEWKLIGITLIVTFFISAIVCGIISEISTRIKNKAQKRNKRQVINQKRNCFKIDCHEFVKANYKTTYIGQDKVLLNELVRMIG